MSNPLQVLHVTDVSAMGYVAEEYKYTSASGLVSENKELVPGDHPVVSGQYASPLTLFFQKSEFHTTFLLFPSPTAAAAPLSFTF
jgi:hypothetical protein